MAVVGERAARRIVVEHAAQQGQVFARPAAQPHAERGQRIGRTAGIEVSGRQHRPAHHGVEERAGALARDEFLVETLLTDLHVEPVLQERLLVKQLPQSGGRLGLDAADGLQVQQVFGAEIVAADIERADVEGSPFPAECRLRVEADAQHCQPVIGRAGLDPAGHIAEHLVGVLQTEGQSNAAELGSKAAGIAEQGATRPNACEKTGLRTALRLRLTLGEPLPRKEQRRRQQRRLRDRHDFRRDHGLLRGDPHHGLNENASQHHFARLTAASSKGRRGRDGRGYFGTGIAAHASPHPGTRCVSRSRPWSMLRASPRRCVRWYRAEGPPAHRVPRGWTRWPEDRPSTGDCRALAAGRLDR